VDIVLCLGVLYHADDAINFLNKCFNFNVPIILETIINTTIEGINFQPENQKDGFSENSGITEDFILEVARNRRYKVKPITSYNYLDYSKATLEIIKKSKFSKGGIPYRCKAWIFEPLKQIK
jgi:hypothetical protein